MNSVEKIKISDWLKTKSHKYKNIVCVKDVAFFKKGEIYDLDKTGINVNQRFKISKFIKQLMDSNFELIQDKWNPTKRDRLIYKLFLKNTGFKFPQKRRQYLRWKGLMKTHPGLCVYFIEEVFTSIEGKDIWFKVDDSFLDKYSSLVHIFYINKWGKKEQKWFEIKELVGRKVEGNEKVTSFIFKGIESEDLLKKKYDIPK